MMFKYQILSHVCILPLTLVTNIQQFHVWFEMSIHFDPGTPSFSHLVKMSLKSRCLSVYLDIMFIYIKELDFVSCCASFLHRDAVTVSLSNSG